jgi:protein-S-isoprenylcysteine O-methyltransferase Ste14
MPSERSSPNDLRGLLTYQWGALLLFYIFMPVGFSWRAYRHGWSDHRPGVANLLGLLPLMAGFAIVMWANLEHLRKARRHGWKSEMIRFEASQYLIKSGPYRYTRNPIYLSHLLVWWGWALFFGSAAVAVAAAIIWTSLVLVVLPYEERRLKDKFGTSYTTYLGLAPRWLGRTS